MDKERMLEGVEIPVVVGDIGGAKETLLAARELEARGLRCRWFADPEGKAKSEVLEKAQIPFETRGPNTDDHPSLILIGTSATASNFQLEWTKFGQSLQPSIPVVWLEDYYGTGSRKSIQEVSPHVMLVIDDIAKEIAQRVRPNLEIRIVGKPSFEESAGLLKHASSIRTEVREQLKLRRGDFLVSWMFGGDPPERAWNQLQSFYDSGNGASFANLGVMVAFRFHPKHQEKDQLFHYAKAYAQVAGMKVVDTQTVKDSKFLLLASDVVFADWGNTDAVFAILGGVPVATVLFPDDKERRIGVGYPDGVPPLLLKSPFWGVQTPAYMRALVSNVFRNYEIAKRSTLQRAEQFEKLLEAGAASRIADEVLMFIEIATPYSYRRGLVSMLQ